MAATSSTRCAHWSPRCTTRSACAPGRATGSCTSATRATRRRSARWRWRLRRSAGSSRSPRSRRSSQFTEPVALLAQTTLSHRDWNDVAVAVKQRYPDAWTPGRSDLCFATTNRQSALMELAARCGAIVVIGSANSSNTRALEKLARRGRVPTRRPGQHRRRDPRRVLRPVARRRRHRRSLGTQRGRRAGHQHARPAQRRRARAGDGGGRVLSSPRKLRDLQAAIETSATAMLGGAPDGRLTDRRPRPQRQHRARRAGRRLSSRLDPTQFRRRHGRRDNLRP